MRQCSDSSNKDDPLGTSVITVLEFISSLCHSSSTRGSELEEKLSENITVLYIDCYYIITRFYFHGENNV